MASFAMCDDGRRQVINSKNSRDQVNAAFLLFLRRVSIDVTVAKS